MVRKGNYIVRLVEAESKTPFKEFTCFDTDKEELQVFAEVEPGQNWYIETEVCGEGEEDVNFTFKVDGKALGYNATQNNSEGKRWNGLWYCNGVNEIERALEFKKPVACSSNAPGAQPVPICPAIDMMGKVEINVYQAIDLGLQVHSEREVVLPSTLASAVKSHFADVKSKGKMLRSGEGTLSIESESDANESSHNYDCGELLESITIQYCTALGLVKAGLLGRPKGNVDNREGAAPTNGKIPSRKKRKKIIAMQPEVLHQRAVYDDNGEVLKPARLIEQFDLTGLSDDEK